MPKTLYACLICGRNFEAEPQAVLCETRPEDKPLAKVGDICTVGGDRFGWCDGDRRWLVNPKAEKGLQFYYVLTHIDGDPENPHRTRYHFFTKAMSPKSGYNKGTTFNVHHFTPRLILEPPAFVVNDSKDLVGKIAEYIL
jgi:hypothetical protein